MVTITTMVIVLQASVTTVMTLDLGAGRCVSVVEAGSAMCQDECQI